MAYTTKTKVVKKSLKFSCAMSKSLPASPEIDKKNVHFADAEGKSLASIKTYVPSYEDLDALRKVFLRNSPFADGSNDEADGSRTRFTALKGSSNRLSKKFLKTSPALEANFEWLSRCFDLLDKDELKERLKMQHIVLEDVEIHGRTIQCQVIVNNIAYEKLISVRHTFDDWKTIQELPATYVPFSSDGNTDRFMFSLTLPKNCRTLLFALRYCINGKEYWDNNCGNNYKISDFA